MMTMLVTFGWAGAMHEIALMLVQRNAILAREGFTREGVKRTWRETTRVRFGAVHVSNDGYVVEPWVRFGRRIGWVLREGDKVHGVWPTCGEAKIMAREVELERRGGGR